VLKEALANELLAQSEHDQQKKALEAKTSADITAIEDKAKKDRDNLAQAEKSAKINAVSQTFGGLSTLMNTESKKLFAIGKAAAIAGAVVDGYAAVSKTMASAPYPLNIGLAAAQGVASAVQIQGIAKQKIGGAQSMGATASFSGGTPTTNTSGGGGGMGDRNISISGLDPSSMFSGEQVRDLLKNMAGDGADFTFLTSGG
jgi:stress-induced morphogen